MDRGLDAAAEADPLAQHLAPIWHALHDDWVVKTKQIVQLEREIARILVKTPYILLLSHPGISVVSAGMRKGTFYFSRYGRPRG